MKITALLKCPFTLIELLVVIAIIGILASLLLPSLQQAKQKGLQAACVNHQKQIGVSVFLYQDDFEERFPMNRPAATLIQQKFLDLALCECPADREYNVYPYSFSVQGGQKHDSGYLWSYRMFGLTAGSPPDSAEVRAMMLEKPEKDPLLADAEWPANHNPYFWNVYYINKAWGSYFGRHHGLRVNTLFADGHARGLNGSEYSNNIRYKGDKHPTTHYHLTE